MSLNNVVSIQSAALSTHKSEELSMNTKMRLEVLGIDPSTVSTESQAQILIAQAEAAPRQNNSSNQEGGKNSTRQELMRDAKTLAESVGVEYCDSDKLENILQKISYKLNIVAEQYPEKRDIVQSYQNRLKDIANRAAISVAIQNNIYGKNEYDIYK